MADEPNAELLAELRRLLGRPDPIGFTRHGIAPGAFSYITRDDRLYIRARNSVTGTVVTISGRIHQPDGTIQAFDFRHTPNTDRSVSLEAFNLGEGYLVGLAVHASVGTVRRGQCWVELGFLRGLAAAASVRQVLGRDYITAGDAWGWPGAPNKSSLDGPGALRSITGTNPAVDTEISEAVPTNARWRLIAMDFRLVTDANVANRLVFIHLDDGTTVFLRSRAINVQVASETEDYTAAAFGTLQTTAAIITPIAVPPDLILGAGFQIVTSTTNLQAGDNYGAPQLLVEEWLEE